MPAGLPQLPWIVYPVFLHFSRGLQVDISSVILMVAVGGFTLVAAVWDLRTKRLPNWITVPAFVAGVIFHVVLGAVTQTPWLSGAGHGLLSALAGFATGFLPLMVLWLTGGGGAGDVKLMGAVGAVAWRQTDLLHLHRERAGGVPGQHVFVAEEQGPRQIRRRQETPGRQSRKRLQELAVCALRRARGLGDLACAGLEDRAAAGLTGAGPQRGWLQSNPRRGTPFFVKTVTRVTVNFSSGD